MQALPSKSHACEVLTNVVAQEQIAAARITRRHEADFSVRLRSFLFIVFWIIIAMTHILCIGTYGVQSWVYKKLPLASLAFSLQQYDVTMPPANFRVVSIAFQVVAIVHSLLLLEMLVASLWYRKFSFRITFTAQKRYRHTVSTTRQRARNTLANQAIRIVNLVIGERGFLGVKGRHFAVIYIVREIFETILQSIQAFRMSQFVPRLLVNRFFVFTIVINCWSTPIIKYLFKHNPPLERLLCLVFDIALDFTSTVGVPLVLAIPYWKQYDFEITNFPYDLFWNDFWLVNMINELRIVFVSSWSNLISELTFSASLLICLQDVKYLLCSYRTITSEKKRSHRKCFCNTVEPIYVGNQSPDILINQNINKVKSALHTNLYPSNYSTYQIDQTNQASNVIPFQDISTRFVHAVHIFMIIWGVLLLVLHVNASFRSLPVHCGQQAWQWFGTKAGCSLLQVNCNKILGSTGNYSELDQVFAHVDEQTLIYIVIRHCPYIEIPARIQVFPNIVGLKIYNSTIASWDTDAAVTTTHHPRLVFLFVVKSNMTRVPQGAMSPDFPSKIKDIEFAWTNLTTLPDNLTDIWPRDGFIMFERSQFLSVPETLLRQSNFQVSMAGGIVTQLPSEVFTNPMATELWLSGNPIIELPDKLVPSTSIQFVDLSNTMLQTLPSWLEDASIEFSVLYAGGSPLCDNMAPIITSGDNSSVTPDLAVAWAAYEMGRLSCWTAGSYFYPYDAEAQQ